MAKQKTHKHNSPKAIWIILAVVVVVLVGAMITNKPDFHEKPQMRMERMQQHMKAFNFGNQKYMINDQELQMNNGSYKNSNHNATIANANVSASRERAAAIVIDSPEGSGSFYYLVGAMKKDGKEIYSTPVLLGDRIRVVSVTAEEPEANDNGEIVVTYLDRAPNAAMADEPTVSKTVKYSFEDNGNLIDVLN